MKTIRIKVTTDDGEEIVEDLFEATRIDQNDLSKEFSQQPALQAWWGKLYADALHELQSITQNIDIVRAGWANEIRKKASQDGKKITEAGMTEALLLHPEAEELADMLNDAKHKENLLKKAYEAIKVKGDMLVSLGAQQRSEMGVVR